MSAFNSCDGTAIFIRLEMKCSIQLGFASLNRTFHLSPHENICTIALITIHYLYKIQPNAGVTRAYFATYNSTIWQFSNQDVCVFEPYF